MRWMDCSDSVWTSSSSFLSLAISASRRRFRSAWLSQPPCASVSLSLRLRI